MRGRSSKPVRGTSTEERTSLTVKQLPLGQRPAPLFGSVSSTTIALSQQAQCTCMVRRKGGSGHSDHSLAQHHTGERTRWRSMRSVLSWLVSLDVPSLGRTQSRRNGVACPQPHNAALSHPMMCFSSAWLSQTESSS